MVERGSTKHSAELDDEMKHETQGMVLGNQPAHVEGFRETEPTPDDTDSEEVRAAFGMAEVEGDDNEEDR
jgi:hypothetical protein